MGLKSSYVVHNQVMQEMCQHYSYYFLTSLTSMATNLVLTSTTTLNKIHADELLHSVFSPSYQQITKMK